ncbi:hypothetical protein HX870_18305 [Pseudomonas gingeri]|uniref:hypothetical protein n=1 Tax=Pseudomonas gingeri TaxID=117681 RepID=UPI0015A25AE8|nr:hypothetical protein [Pseudomonas gingeri]NWA24171.1 hypothetical protein [Pseudomonas gingeri]NWD69556.1 hypothetical protein [Pseudomonas gingeri]NWD78585.1 hypothetical protein [Pseudomonas gingeri]
MNYTGSIIEKTVFVSVLIQFIPSKSMIEPVSASDFAASADDNLSLSERSCTEVERWVGMHK